jgi:hypothetical protein
VPDIRTLQLGAAVIAILSFLLLFRFQRGMLVTLTAAMLAGLVLSGLSTLR